MKSEGNFMDDKNKGVKENKYEFLDDRPAEEDAIGHYRIIADQLFETIHCNLGKPFVVGLFGSWGTGKSSIIKMLEARCEKEKNTKVIVVDAWRKEKSIFNRQFLKKIAKELFGDGKSFKAVKKAVDEKKTESTSNWKPSVLAWGIFIIFVLIFTSCIAGSIWAWLHQKNETNPFAWDSIAGAIIGIFVAFYFQLILPRFSIGTTTEIDDISIHDIEHFRDIYFNLIIKKTDVQRICIVVDNLDRVDAEEALSIMQMLKTFIVDAKEDRGTKEEVEQKSLNKVVFIIPCSDEELKIHIKCSKAVGKEGEFLDKFFNISFRIPNFLRQDVFRYVSGLLNKMALDFDEQQNGMICHIASQFFGESPRKAKIFLNNFLMLYNIATACEEEGKIENGLITRHPDWLAILLAYRDQEKKAGIEGYLGKLRQEISQEFYAAATHLKRPSDFEKIENFSDLLSQSQQNDDGFAKYLLENQTQSQQLIDAVWRNTDASDAISQGNVIVSVINAICLNNQIQISAITKNGMAEFFGSRFIQDMPVMPGKLVYDRMLKGNAETVTNVIKNLGSTVNGIRLSDDRIKFSIELFESILEDLRELLQRGPTEYSSSIEQQIPKAFERFLILGVAIIPIALRYPQYKSKKIFDKTLSLCTKADKQIPLDNFVAYSISFDKESTDNIHNCIKETIRSIGTAIELYCNRNKWKEPDSSKHCCDLLGSFFKGEIYAHNHDIAHSYTPEGLAIINRLFDYADEHNQLAIIEILNGYKNFERWTGAKDIATTHLKTKSEYILEHGSERIVTLFIMKYQEIIKQKSNNIINTVANRFKSVCHLVINEFPNQRNGIIPEVWKQHSKWVKEWIEDNGAKIDEKQKRILQNILFSMVNNNGHDIGLYEAMNKIKIGNDEEVINARNKHFGNFISSKKEQLNTINGLQFVLERIDKAGYSTTDEQNILLCEKWRGIDQHTVGSDLKQLVKKIIRI